MVRSAEIVPPSRLESVATGSRRKPYRQVINLIFGAGGDLDRVVGSCSYPVGANPTEYRRLDGNHRARFLTMADLSILSKLSCFTLPSWPPAFDWPDGEVLEDFLHEIVDTGCARANNARGPALVWEGPRRTGF